MNFPTFRHSAVFALTVFLISSFVPAARATNWYVDAAATGGVYNGTTPATAWRTFAAIAQASLAGGDVVWVKSGTYDERFTISKSGTSVNARITYAATGPTKPVLRGILSNGFDYIGILGLEFSQPNASYNYNCITFNSGCDGWLVEDCYFHDTYGGGIDMHTNACSNNIIRHNTFNNIAWIGLGVSGGNTITVTGHNNLIEYNLMAQTLDRVYGAGGTGNVIRNNAFTASDAALYTATVLYPFHRDGFQSADGTPVLQQLLFEKNWDADNEESVGGNGHHFIVQDYGPGTVNWLLTRFNVVIRPASGAFILQNITRVYNYNSTYIGICNRSPSVFQNAFYYGGAIKGDIADYRNNTWSLCPNLLDAGGIFATNSTTFPTSFTSDYQHSFNSGGTFGILPTATNNLPHSDPKFTNAGTDDYTLQATSPLKGAGGPLTTAVGAGAGSTSLTVADSKRLFDGWGVAEADMIKIGSGAYVQISSINYTTNVVTLSAARTWNNGDGVIVKGMEDVGALPYDYAKSYSITNTTPIVIPAGPATLTATVTNPEAVRKVEFLVDRIPVGEVYAAPYSLPWTSDGVIHAITARAYSAWASPTLSLSDNNVTPKITSQPATVLGTVGAPAAFTVGATGYPTPAIQWYKGGVLIPGATSSTYTIPSPVSGDAGAYTAVATNIYGTATSNVANLYLGVVPPYVVSQSPGQSVISGANVVLFFFVGGTPPPDQVWYRNGVPYSTGPVLNLNAATSAVSGTYTNVATNSAGSITSNSMVVSVKVPSRLANVSIRTFPGTGAQVLIAGFVTTGASKSIMIRGVGPGLAPYVGIPVFADPVLNLYEGSNTVPTQTNDDWGSGATLKSLFARLGAFALPDGSKDAVLSLDLAPKVYSAQVNGTGNGLGLAEVYDADTAENPTGKIVNLSARTQVGTADAVLIAGFVITGDFPKQVLIRGIGPTLTGYGVPGALADPKLDLYNAGGTIPIQTNDNWGGTAELKAAFSAVGAFSLPDDSSKDAALLVTLNPGAYSAIVSGVNSTTGVALVEIYEVQ